MRRVEKTLEQTGCQTALPDQDRNESLSMIGREIPQRGKEEPSRWTSMQHDEESWRDSRSRPNTTIPNNLGFQLYLGHFRITISKLPKPYSRSMSQQNFQLIAIRIFHLRYAGRFDISLNEFDIGKFQAECNRELPDMSPY